MQIERIRTTSAYILGGNIGVSYNTPQAISLDGISFVTENRYSNTTDHHRTEILRKFDDSQIIEVQHATLLDLINSDVRPEDVHAEYNVKDHLIRLLQGEPGQDAILDNQIKAVYTRPISNHRREFKNTFRTYTTFKTNFKFVSNFHYKKTTYWKYRDVVRNSKHYKYAQEVKAVISF